MRISDWSSDVCSSDLRSVSVVSDSSASPKARTKSAALLARLAARKIARLSSRKTSSHDPTSSAWRTVGTMPSAAQMKSAGISAQIGRASCRVRVCQDVENTVAAVSIKKKTNTDKVNKIYTQ